MRTQPRIRTRSHRELLNVPGVCLGFHPRESCVVLGVAGNTVEFCARVDLAGLCADSGAFMAQIGCAIGRAGVDSLALLAYSSTPELYEEPLRELLEEWQPWFVVGLVADENRYWDLMGRPLWDQTPRQWDAQSSSVMASAVYQGVSVAADRDAAVAMVRGILDPLEAELLTEQARAHVVTLDTAGRIQLLDALLGSADPLLPIEGAELALLLREPVLAGEALDHVLVPHPGRVVERLAEARRAVSEAEADDVLAVLGLACWADGRGPQLAECLRQLDTRSPRHPLLPWLAELHGTAAPPPS